MTAYAQGTFVPRNSNKYVGKGHPRYRSGWELAFFNFCDSNQSVLEWASEAIAIRYRHPFTNKITNYVPDVFIRYQDQHKKIHTEIIEIKPRKQSMIEGRMNERERMTVAVNHAKWAAARAWCAQSGMVFRVLTEDSLFHNGGKKTVNKA